MPSSRGSPQVIYFSPRATSALSHLFHRKSTPRTTATSWDKLSYFSPRADPRFAEVWKGIVPSLHATWSCGEMIYFSPRADAGKENLSRVDSTWAHAAVNRIFSIYFSPRAETRSRRVQGTIHCSVRGGLVRTSGATPPQERTRSSLGSPELVTSILQHHLLPGGRDRGAPQLALYPNTRLRPMVRGPHHLLLLTGRNVLEELLLLSYGDEEPNLLDTIHGHSPTTRIRMTQPLPRAPSNRTLPIEQSTIVRRRSCLAHSVLHVSSLHQVQKRLHDFEGNLSSPPTALFPTNKSILPHATTTLHSFVKKSPRSGSQQGLLVTS